MAKKIIRGKFITFEGPEGSGKSTHCKLVYQWLRRKGYKCIYVHEPGTTEIGNRIRKILLDPAQSKMELETEFFLFEASRSQIVREIILPALKNKKIVICDRFNDATFVYQGWAGGMDMALVKRIDRIATGGLKPDFTILMDVEAKKGLVRSKSAAMRDRMEKKSLTFHRKVRRGYLATAKKEPSRVKVIDATGPLDKTQALVKKEISRFLKLRTGK